MQPAGRFTVPAAHSSLPGHFPGRPVVPGVVLLDEVFALILAQHPGHRVGAVAAVKFTAPVLPGHEVTVLQGVGPRGAEPDGHLPFACTVDGRPALRGTLRLDPA